MIKTNLKYAECQVVFSEIPDEVTLAINLTKCPIKCPDCHSKYLWNDEGTTLTDIELGFRICENDGITCVSFMGGDSNPKDILKLAKVIKEKYQPLKVAWYTGKTKIDPDIFENLKYFDYIKIGPYLKERGPLNNKKTNQRMFANVKSSSFFKEWDDITYKFWKNDSRNNK